MLPLIEEKLVGEIMPPEPEPVPEPASMLGLALVGTFGAVSTLKRKCS